MQIFLLLGVFVLAPVLGAPVDYYDNGYNTQQTSYNDNGNADASIPDFNRQIYPVDGTAQSTIGLNDGQYYQPQYTGAQSPINLQDDFNNQYNQNQQPFIGVQSTVDQIDDTNQQYSQPEPIVNAQSPIGLNDGINQEYNNDPTFNNAPQQFGVQSDYNQYDQQQQQAAVVLRRKRDQPSTSSAPPSPSTSITVPAPANVAAVEFHTSHRIPEHVEAIRRQSEEHNFHTAHQIPSHPPPVVVALHPKGDIGVVEAVTRPSAATDTMTTAKQVFGQRHRRDTDAPVTESETSNSDIDNSEISASNDEKTTVSPSNSKSPAAGSLLKPTENPSKTQDENASAAQHEDQSNAHPHSGLHFPVPVDRILKHSQAAPQIYHQYDTKTIIFLTSC